MLQPVPSTPSVPHHCGVNNPAGAARCWLCGESLGGPGVPLEQVETPAPPRFTFALSSLLWFVLGCSVCMAIARWLPKFGIVLMAVVIPAGLKTAWELKRRDHRLPLLAKVEVLLGATFGTLVLGIAVTIAFGIPWMVGAVFVGRTAAWLAGIVAAVFAAWQGLRIWLK